MTRTPHWRRPKRVYFLPPRDPKPIYPEWDLPPTATVLTTFDPAKYESSTVWFFPDQPFRFVL